MIHIDEKIFITFYGILMSHEICIGMRGMSANELSQSTGYPSHSSIRKWKWKNYKRLKWKQSQKTTHHSHTRRCRSLKCAQRSDHPLVDSFNLRNIYWSLLLTIANGTLMFTYTHTNHLQKERKKTCCWMMPVFPCAPFLTHTLDLNRIVENTPVVGRFQRKWSSGKSSISMVY